MRILLLGANSQLGYDLIRVQAELFPEFELIPITRKQLDVTNKDSIQSILCANQFDVLINCISYNRTDDAEGNIEQAMTVNAQAVKKIALACKENDKILIHLSTDYVFGADSSINRPYTENDVPAPLNVYGSSKYLGECYARYINSKTYILRVASLFGLAGSSGKGGNFVETIIRLCREKKTVPVINDTTVSPTSTKDVALIIYKLLSAKAPFGIYHCTNSHQATWYEFASKIREFCNLPGQIVPISHNQYPSKIMRALWSVLSNDKTSEIIGQIRPWEEALRDYLKEKGHL